MNHKCVYCYMWVRSPITKKSNSQEDEDTKKKSKRLRHSLIERKCIIGKKIITMDSEACEYFKPAISFRCDKNNHDIAFIACLHRRFNQDGLETYKDCKKCRQFDTDIKYIMKDFWINAKQPIEPKNQTKKSQSTTERVIKRRSKKEIRIIKRRSKKKTRVIKRRK